MEEIDGYIRSVENNPIKQYEICQQMEKVEIERKNEQRKFLSTLKGVFFDSGIVSEGHNHIPKVKTIALKKYIARSKFMITFQSGNKYKLIYIDTNCINIISKTKKFGLC